MISLRCPSTVTPGPSQTPTAGSKLSRHRSLDQCTLTSYKQMAQVFFFLNWAINFLFCFRHNGIIEDPYSKPSILKTDPSVLPHLSNYVSDLVYLPIIL